MSKDNNPDGQKNYSFIEAARRSQINACAIEVIAAMGYAQTSLAQIAKQAGISKGVISYHFSSKDEIIEQIVTDVYAAGASFMKSYLEAETSAAGKLRAYIESNLAFMRTHPKQIVAVTEIVSSARTEEGKHRFDMIKTDVIVDYLTGLLLQGAKEGDFREFSDFSARVMAMTIRSAIDGVGFQLAADLDLDLEQYAKELVTLFGLAVRKV
ncbi:TetR/AcrR family transcriptional regulator [Paenibacillus humicola]|uniref:TetR/AcrR family transcriptional regulator n=1 Tax=Paenibacillus humicola TaxID=3110540 RepID=UPI00237A3152|nr:TetR/AcrR family transcriptional regulator [Paenibacillus humicola]